MNNKDFSICLTNFFTKYLTIERGYSDNTIKAYSECFTNFINYMDIVKRKKSDHIGLDDMNHETVLSFLQWMQENANICNNTWNQRLAAMRSFARYMQYEDVIHIKKWQEIIEIRLKKHEDSTIKYVSVEGMKLILSQIPTNNTEGRRNLAMLSLMYDSAARVQEIADLTPADLHLKKPAYVKLFGKGKKTRIVPLQDKVANMLHRFLEEHNKRWGTYGRQPLFCNNRGGKFTTAGIAYILAHYVKMAHAISPELVPEKFSPHCVRHSKAMHLLQADVNLVYIRDILGHKSTQTTEIYARADSKKKREALEQAYQDVIPNETTEKPQWEKDSKLKAWLKTLGR